MPKQKKTDTNPEPESTEVEITTQNEEAESAAEDTTSDPAAIPEQNAEAEEPSMQPEEKPRGITPSRPFANQSDNVVPEVPARPREPRSLYRPVEMRNPLTGPGRSLYITAYQHVDTGEIVLPAAVQRDLLEEAPQD